MMKKRKVPMRICIGCQQKIAKKELIRVVRTPEGEIVLDNTGKKSGRGAYLCAKRDCLKKAIKGRRLEKNLQMPVREEIINDLAVLLGNDEEVNG
ncbi:MAG: RNase P modulator RnpM [Bacillota bacterium]